MNRTAGVVTLLDDEICDRVEGLWQLLEDECGLSSIRVTPLVHFSWQVAEDYNDDLAKAVLEEISGSSQPFRVYTTGLGLFTGPSPVIYVPIVKNPKLIALHERLWDRLKDCRSGDFFGYNPRIWLPHITLSYGDVNEEKLLCAISRLSALDFNWEIMVDNLAYGYLPPGGFDWVKFRYDFK